MSAHCRVQLCHQFRSNSPKIIQCWGSHGTWLWSTVITSTPLVCYIGSCWLMSLLGRGLHLTGIQKHWLDCRFGRGSNRTILNSDQIVVHSPFYWSTSSRQRCDQTFCNVFRRRWASHSTTSILGDRFSSSVGSSFDWFTKPFLPRSGLLHYRQRWVPLTCVGYLLTVSSW